MLKWQGKVEFVKVRLSCNSKYCHNVQIFSQEPLKFSCAQDLIKLFSFFLLNSFTAFDAANETKEPFLIVIVVVGESGPTESLCYKINFVLKKYYTSSKFLDSVLR